MLVFPKHTEHSRRNAWYQDYGKSIINTEHKSDDGIILFLFTMQKFLRNVPTTPTLNLIPPTDMLMFLLEAASSAMIRLLNRSGIASLVPLESPCQKLVLQ